MPNNGLACSLDNWRPPSGNPWCLTSLRVVSACSDKHYDCVSCDYDKCIVCQPPFSPDSDGFCVEPPAPPGSDQPAGIVISHLKILLPNLAMLTLSVHSEPLNNNWP